MLDVDYGSYPFVTSSSTACAGACIGLGVNPHLIGHVYGIFKAYCTRVGSGPFPTELFDETGEEIRRIGHEFGAVTGRPRRCGWLDLVALKYAVMISGVTDLIMMKSDCLDTFETIKVCTSYIVDGKPSDQWPFDTYADIEPVYTEFKGWHTDLTHCRAEEELPQEFRDYIAFMEQYLGVPIKIISVGPDREATIMR
jgi:adenylosuccinate synthase